MPNLVSIAAASTPPRMSSREIAELTGKRHDHVLRDIKVMLQGLGLTDPKFGGSYFDPTGRRLPCFNLPKRECLILVSGYDVGLRARIIDRWMELEADTAAPAMPLDPSDPRVIAAVMDALHARVAEMQEKVEVYDRVSDTSGSHSITEVAKMMRLARDDLFAFMRSNQWLFRRNGGHDQAFQHRLRAGLLEVKLVLISETRSAAQVRVLSKGVGVLGRELAAAGKITATTLASLPLFASSLIVRH